MTIDKRFALIDRDGAYRYPYKKSQRETGRYGFVLGRDRHGGGIYTDDLESVIRAVVFNGESVRVRTDDKNLSKRGNSLSLHAQQEIVGYWISPELFSWVAGASFRPVNEHQPSDGNNKSLLSPLEGVDGLTVDDYVLAFDAIKPNITANQQAMLIGHASVPSHTLSMEVIAKFGGYESHSTANVWYGKLGRLFADYFGIEGLENQTQILAIPGPANDEGHWQWIVRPTLVDALEQLGLIERVAEGPGLMEASLEVNSDPQTQAVSETTKQALINARIGQGGYRRRMIRLWGGRCAVTNCSIETVLVASHAKPWANSSNRERLDEYNGLLLAASIDRLFDNGLIAFADDGQMLFSSFLEPQCVISVGLSQESRLRFVCEEHKPYLKAHREQHGF